MSIRRNIQFLLMSIGLFAVVSVHAKDYPDPKRFEGAIKKFEAEKAPPEGAIVGAGSSSMRMWNTIKKDLAPHTIVHRGFGGSNMNDLLHYADRIILPYKPRAVVIYEGDNDIAHGVTPEKIHETFNKLVDKIHQKLPETRIYFLTIKPSVKRWKMWPEMAKANKLIADECSSSKLLTYVDTATPMLNEKGEPQRDLFVKDMLHMNDKGYRIWTGVLKPVLDKGEK